jgi:V8-like Glu-specific endopeptidase
VRARLALIAVPLLVLSLLPAGASANSTHDSVGRHRAAVLAYWTPERMATAIPREVVPAPGHGTRDLKKPAPPPVTGDTTTGSSWTGSGIMLTATGRVYFSMGGSDWICSGSVLDDSKPSHSIVLTAGHCVVDETTGEFATNWLFIPAFDLHPTYTCGNTEYGCWVADGLYADKLFATAGAFNDQAVQHDWGFAVAGPGGLSNAQLDATVGSLPIAYDQAYSGDTLSAFGYPAAGKYHGKDLVYCRGVVGTDPNTSGTTWSMPCDMTGGSSGGPWVQADDTATYADATVGSLNSYGYTGLKYMFGPKFNSIYTKAVYDSADTGNLSPKAVTSEIP